MSQSSDNRTSRSRRPVARAVTADLLRRYDRPGPRYTSYPTAVEFGEAVDADLYDGLLAAADRLCDEPLSVYMHLPFCAEQCLFCACHVIITPHYERALPYLELLQKEIDLVADRLPNRRQISQLHLGGGTPTYYEPEELQRLLEHLFGCFRLRSGAELAVEVDPRVTRADHLDVLAEYGFNRISMGVQDFTLEVQQAVHREQSVGETEELVQQALDRGFQGINIDLIYGLPLQSPQTFERTVETVIGLQVHRVALYSFALVPWMRGHQKKIPEDYLPDREVKFELFATARERFLEAGYEPIGMDHFALPEDELARARGEHRLRRNFQGYTVLPAPDVIGLGISAIGDVGGAYVQSQKKLTTYAEALTGDRLPVLRGVVRSRDDEIRRQVIHELMCNFRVDIRALERQHEIDFAAYFASDLQALRQHADQGMVRFDDELIEATPTGELFVRNLALCFDRYRRQKDADGESPVFSRTV